MSIKDTIAITGFKVVDSSTSDSWLLVLHYKGNKNINTQISTKKMIKLKNVLIDWDHQKERLKEKYSILTDKDLNFEQGKMELMLTKLQNKLGKTRHEVYKIFADL